MRELKCFGVAHSESNQFQVVLPKSVPRAMKPFKFQNAQYKFYRADLSFGLESSVIDDVRVKHFSKERILLEGLMFPDRFLGINEFLNSIGGFSWIDLDKLMGSIGHYPLTTISMRLGWLLENNQCQHKPLLYREWLPSTLLRHNLFPKRTYWPAHMSYISTVPPSSI